MGDGRPNPLQGVSVISHHKSWDYLYDWLGIKEVATLEGPGRDAPPERRGIWQELVDVLKRPPAPHDRALRV